ncbi:hypothetical protein [Amycolatopsis nigrescens]|uniref:hypothetical protein n=1 Tax=Amycolatopsis nigrescens TaxID=381445 RepID=UPI000369CBB4|nr:hypothetical protein [Amycolatopsis nigrescens]
MSPVSRVRKTQSSNEEDAQQSVNGFFKDVLRDFAELGNEPEHLQVELLTSEIMGEWWEADDDLGPELIEFAERKANPAAAALLTALSVLAETADQRRHAADALAKVVAGGLPEPEWAPGFAQVAAGECWRTSDVYGDASSVLCVFGEGETAHGVLALVDFTEFSGWVKDVVVVESPDEVLAEMRDQAVEGGELVTVEQLPPEFANRLLTDGLAATDRFEDPEVSADFIRFRALALARLRSLPEPAPEPEPAEWTAEQRDEAVAEFFAAVSAEKVEDTPAARAVAGLIVDFGCAHDPRRPLRVGPEKLAYFLDALSDAENELDDELIDALGEVLLGWAEWAGARDGLSETAVAALTDLLAESLEEFGQDESVLDAYLDDVDGTEDGEPLDPAEVAELLDRRMFAIPSVYTEIGGEELELSPGDPEQRRLLVIGEHPEYHESLAGDEFDGEPRFELAVKTTVVDQLWENDPPEVWQAAQRLVEKGLEREEVLLELGRVLGEQLRQTEDERLEFDLEDYCRGLSALG